MTSDRIRWQAGNLLIPGIFDGLDLDDDLREIFARSLGFWLERRNLSQAELARRMSTARSTVNHWLNAEGGTDLMTLREVARVVQVPPWYLLHDRPEELPDPLSGQKPEMDEAEHLLRRLAAKLGFRARLERLKKAGE